MTDVTPCYVVPGASISVSDTDTAHLKKLDEDAGKA